MQKCKHSHSLFPPICQSEFALQFARASTLKMHAAWTASLESSTTLERFLTFSCSLALPRSPFYRPFSWFELTRTQFSQGSHDQSAVGRPTIVKEPSHASHGRMVQLRVGSFLGFVSCATRVGRTSTCSVVLKSAALTRWKMKTSSLVVLNEVQNPKRWIPGKKDSLVHDLSW